MYITNKYRVSYSLTEIKNPSNTGIAISTTDANSKEGAIQNIKEYLNKYWTPDYKYEIISVELIKENVVILSYDDITIKAV